MSRIGKFAALRSVIGKLAHCSTADSPSAQTIKTFRLVSNGTGLALEAATLFV